MNKSELIEALAEAMNIPIREAASITNTIIETMSDALARGESIEIRGFGSFSLHHRPSRVGRNPKTGEPVSLPEKFVPHFKPGKELRDRVDAAAAAAEAAEAAALAAASASGRRVIR